MKFTTLARTFSNYNSHRIISVNVKQDWNHRETVTCIFFLSLDSNDKLTSSLQLSYSNTLFVTFNNRIYFRDHTPPGGLVTSPYRSSAPQPATIPLNFSRPQASRSATISSPTSVGLDSLHSKSEADLEKGITVTMA